jgi:CheY-like chemotaxis protein
LVAEDNPINREVMREILEELEIEADLVENGREAVEAVESRDYPLILMDCQMPEMDGYEATRRIRRRTDDRAKIPIVAVTAHAVQGEREKAIAAGMTDYVTKPVTITRLVRTMSKYLETQKISSEKPVRTANESAQPARKPLPSVADSGGVLEPGVKRSAVVTKLFRKMVPDQLEGLSEAIASGDGLEVAVWPSEPNGWRHSAP